VRVVRDRLTAFVRFWYVVGDDWTIAAGVAATLAITYGLLQAKPIPAWWLPPLACVAIVAWAVRRANVRAAPRRRDRSA
jgi:hypothetical protein